MNHRQRHGRPTGNRARAALAGLGLLLTAFAALQASSAHAEGDAAAGKTKAHTCLGCHGVQHYVNTYPTYHVPFIAGQHETYLISALKDYRSRNRPHGTMQANAGLLTDQDIADIAAYFSSQGKTVKASDGKGAPSSAAVCAACHLADGNSNQPVNPILAGQYESYLAQALTAYRSGERNNAIMAGMAAALSDDDIDELSAWFASQKGPMQTAE